MTAPATRRLSSFGPETGAAEARAIAVIKSTIGTAGPEIEA
jgi:hypothetical protein